MSEEKSREERHNARMQRKKAVVEARMAAAPEERGVLVINTRNGKGKSSSTSGVAARARDRGTIAAVIQLVQGRPPTVEGGFYRRVAE